MNFRSILPEGLFRLHQYEERFRQLGLSPRLAWQRQYRLALEISQIELLSRDWLGHLACVVDVGANVGEWSIALARLTTAQRIIAYEPNPEVFAQLQTNVAPFSQITVRQSAIGASIGQVALHVETMHQLSSIWPMRDEALAIHGLRSLKSQTVDVPLTTLDHDLQGHDEISLLKVDVQGYEPEVLTGAQEVLKRTQLLMIEILYMPYYQGTHTFDKLANFLVEKSKFHLWGISAPHCSPTGQPVWADAVFVRDRLK